jgi:hypothetical protein
LLAQQPDSVGDLVDEAIVECDGSGYRGSAQPVLARERGSLPTFAVAVAMEPGGGARERLRPRCAELSLGLTREVLGGHAID